MNEDALREAFEAGRAAGAYDQWCDSAGAKPPAPAPDFEEWLAERRRAGDE
jgi:hypothetical protein